MREADRMKRAGDYVLGLMADGERERAERDLEIDPAFRNAVISIAERMHMLDIKDAPTEPDGAWRSISARIAEMPQMRVAGVADPSLTTQTESEAAKAGLIVPSPVRQHRRLDAAALPNARAFAVACALAGSCLLGYAAGVMTGDLW
jgi:hypothetical protein